MLPALYRLEKNCLGQSQLHHDLVKGANIPNLRVNYIIRGTLQLIHSQSQCFSIFFFT